MKRIVVFCFAIALMLASICMAIYTFRDYKMISQIINSEVEALTFSNEGPGGVGERQTQAVWCGGGGWSVAPGCCYGASNCTYIQCDSNIFSCDGNTWIAI